jgi:ferredoxin
MAYVITHLCVNCLDKGCVEVCPVECIYEPKEVAPPGRPNMLYIHPTECINCGACEPECPWQAIFEDRELPDIFAADLAINAQTQEDPKQFRVALPHRDAEGRLQPKARPSTEQVRANRKRWEESR